MPNSLSPSSPRGRPREFDTDLAIERAMQVFWSEGYHRTSLPALLAATELSRGSLYGAFEDKRGLFLRALARYIDQALVRLVQELASGHSALDGVRTCMAGYIERISGVSGERGCLVVATAMELAAHDPGVAAQVGRFFEAMQKHLTTALARARAEGDLGKNMDPATFAYLLVCIVEGQRVVHKVGLEPERARAAIAALFDRLTK